LLDGDALLDRVPAGPQGRAFLTATV
jgi:hypothetical protein